MESIQEIETNKHLLLVLKILITGLAYIIYASGKLLLNFKNDDESNLSLFCNLSLQKLAYQLYIEDVSIIIAVPWTIQHGI